MRGLQLINCCTFSKNKKSRNRHREVCLLALKDVWLSCKIPWCREHKSMDGKIDRRVVIKEPLMTPAQHLSLLSGIRCWAGVMRGSLMTTRRSIFPSIDLCSRHQGILQLSHTSFNALHVVRKYQMLYILHHPHCCHCG